MDDDAVLKNIYKYLIVAISVLAAAGAYVTGYEEGWIIVLRNFLIGMAPVYLAGALFFVTMVIQKIHERDNSQTFWSAYWSWSIGNVIAYTAFILALVPYIYLIVLLGSI